MLRDLTVGSSLFLPVAKAGARVWVGGVQALQSDGVVDQTSIETAAEDLQIRYDLHKGIALGGPPAETATHWVGIGFGASLHAASGISRGEAYALCSYTSIPPKAAHGLGVFRDELRRRIDRWLRPGGSAA